MTRILIVDDHVSVQESLSTAFDAQEDFAVVGTCSSAAYAPLYCEKLQPDLVFMDVCTEKGASGIEAVETLRRQFPKLKIIVMTAFEEVTYVPRARQAGADILLFGHTHQAYAERLEDGLWVMNPGSCQSWDRTTYGVILLEKTDTLCYTVPV